jgi:hypothetical protein
LIIVSFLGYFAGDVDECPVGSCWVEAQAEVVVAVGHVKEADDILAFFDEELDARLQEGVTVTIIFYTLWEGFEFTIVSEVDCGDGDFFVDDDLCTHDSSSIAFLEVVKKD